MKKNKKVSINELMEKKEKINSLLEKEKISGYHSAIVGEIVNEGKRNEIENKILLVKHKQRDFLPEKTIKKIEKIVGEVSFEIVEA